MNNQHIRVRIAPSPTGMLHIGTTRTALFNYLFARHHGGTYVLRMEDTDTERSKAEYTQNIIKGFQNLGLNWDEGPDTGGAYGPYTQSERTHLYTEALQSLITKQSAYPCFCTPDDLQQEKELAERNKSTYIYSGKCRQLSAEECQHRIKQGTPHVYRLKTPSKSIIFEDLVRGEIEFHSSTIGDFIIAKGLSQPIYNFAVVVDDVGMKITHVLRGEDHISNTPKQILIYEALGYEPPLFGHTAMMLAPDRSKLSKRHGATSISDYLQMGVLKEALINYLALLGWSPPEGQEILSLEELISHFSLDKVTKSGAIFDIEKLKWVNGQWIRRMSPEELLHHSRPFLTAFDLDSYSDDWLKDALNLVSEKVNLLTDLPDQLDFLLLSTLDYKEEGVKKAFQMPSASDVLTHLKAQVEASPDWQLEQMSSIFETLKNELDYKMKQIMWPIRAALSGRTFGPDLQKSMVLLGKERVLSRIDHALNELERFANV